MVQLNRRQMLLAISKAAVASQLMSCTDPVSDTLLHQPETDLQLVAALAYDLFPFPNLDPVMYVQVAEHILAGSTPTFEQGLQELRTASGNLHWLDLDESLRIELLANVEKEPFFAHLRQGTIEILYRSTVTFDMIGYGGSAIEHGGYINRGFDQIDWLPLTGDN
jgi:hypothetical protein